MRNERTEKYMARRKAEDKRFARQSAQAYFNMKRRLKGEEVPEEKFVGRFHTAEAGRRKKVKKTEEEEGSD